VRSKRAEASRLLAGSSAFAAGLVDVLVLDRLGERLGGFDFDESGSAGFAAGLVGAGAWFRSS